MTLPVTTAIVFISACYVLLYPYKCSVFATWRRESPCVGFNLSYRSISHVGDILKKRPDEKNINLSNNTLTTVDDNTFYSAVSLSCLDLSGNKITNISSNAFINNINLTWLSLAGNTHLNFIPELFTSSLKFWNLSHCNLVNITRRNFDGVSAMTQLDLSHNFLASVPHEVITSLTHLEVIDISHNHIHSLDFEAWLQFQFLRHMNISNNRLTTIPFNAAEFIEQLDTFDYRNNPWDCECYMFSLYKNLASSSFHLNLICESPAYYKGKVWHFWANEFFCSEPRANTNESNAGSENNDKTTPATDIFIYSSSDCTCFNIIFIVCGAYVMILLISLAVFVWYIKRRVDQLNVGKDEDVPLNEYSSNQN